MSKRRVRSDSFARRAIRTRRPSQTDSNWARVIASGRGDNGCWTRTLSSATLPRIRKPPSRSAAIPGNGVVASRSQFVVGARALSPNSLAQRSISVTPMLAVPHRWRTWLELGSNAITPQQHYQSGKPRIFDC